MTEALLHDHGRHADYDGNRRVSAPQAFEVTRGRRLRVDSERDHTYLGTTGRADEESAHDRDRLRYWPVSQGSRRGVMVGLVLPGVLTLLTVLTMLWMLPQAPDSIVMQWSGDGAARSGSPAELLFLPMIAMAASLLVWAAGPMGKLGDARGAMVAGNGIAAFMNSVAITLLAGQLTGEADGSLPAIALMVSLIPAGIVALITFFAAVLAGPPTFSGGGADDTLRRRRRTEGPADR